jgi:hypothetical protein
VTIDKYGLITVAGTAQLSDINSITVRAAYHDKTYDAILGITKARGGTPGTPGGKGEKGDPALAPRYRGVALAADTGNTGKITASGSAITANEGDWVLFMGDSGWNKYYLYQWNGTAWVRLDRERNVSKYADVIDDITEGAPDGIFSAMFCRILFAQQAAINTLQSRLIHVLNAIYGGDRFNEDGSVKDDSKAGFWLGADGRLKAADGEFSGELHAKNAIYGAIPEPAGGTLLKSISGYKTESLYLDAGWYYVELAGAGGGNGNNYSGGKGGYLKQSFFISYDHVYVRLMSGEAGTNSVEGKQDYWTGGGGGGGSVIDIPEMGLVFIANGGGGCGTKTIDGGGRGGGYGGGGGGSPNGSSGGTGGRGGNADGGDGGYDGGGPSGGGGALKAFRGGKGVYGGEGGYLSNGSDGGNNVNNTAGGGSAAATNGWAKLYKL